MTELRKAFAAIALFIALGSVPSFAAGSPAPLGDGFLPFILGSAQALAYGPYVTGLDAPWADRLNPAASGAEQRTTLDAGYTALTDFGKPGKA